MRGRFIQRWAVAGVIGLTIAGFVEHEGSALVFVGARIGAGLLRAHHLGGERLAIILRPVTQAARVRVVVPRSPVVRYAVHDLEADAGMVDADRDELRDVARGNPDREAALVDRARVHVPDADVEDLEAVLVGIEAPDRLAEDLGHAVAAVGPGIDAMVDGLVAAVEACCVGAGREDGALHAIHACGFEDVVRAPDRRLEGRVPRSPGPNAPEMDGGAWP